MSTKAVIGIDTSNYTTSVAAASESGEILFDERKLLVVPEEKRGLRQQEALFQHIENLPGLIGNAEETLRGLKIKAVAASVSPRPVEGSYMPVFECARSFGSSLAGVLGVPFLACSHQEGHIRAAQIGNGIEGRFAFFHLSGGTLEAVDSKTGAILAKTLDLSFGQLIDRTGVKLGMRFPAGKEMDRLAGEWNGTDGLLRIPRSDTKQEGINLSGQETFLMQRIEALPDPVTDMDKQVVAASLFRFIADTLAGMIRRIETQYGIESFLLAGGVSSSTVIRERLAETLEGGSPGIRFGKPQYCTDNAVGTALIGKDRTFG